MKGGKISEATFLLILTNLIQNFMNMYFSDTYNSEFTECEAGKLSPEFSHGC